MATFDTPEPISLDVELGIGNVRIDASDGRRAPSRCDRATRPTRPM